MSSELSLKKRIETIDDFKRGINRAADLLSGYLDKLTTEDNPENSENIQRIHREVRTMVTQSASLMSYVRNQLRK